MKSPSILRLAACILAARAVSAGPIEFDFVAPANPAAANPFLRELWAEVTTPGGQKLTLPAYYADEGLYAVRARPDEVGPYRFGAVFETTLGVNKTGLVVSLVTPAEVNNATRRRLPWIRLDPKDPRRFLRSDGLPYLPVGANLAWAPDGVVDRVGYYQRAFPAFAKANLNWMRIWMASWDGLNLDWLPPDMGASPRLGTLSSDVADNWDKILAAAEENGVYVQMVLQHHGQYTTANDSDWAKNPWNAANPGGFLKSPEDFFTDPTARVMTLIKYRYIVARWGWSPAIVAWELFNEVHWTDAMRNGHEADVARWHSEAAAAIRLVDVYGHLITTSTENLRSPIYDKMDYYQPHLYAANLIAGARTFGPYYAELKKPVFYGEEGDDHEPLTDEVKKAGLTLIPPVWASIMGEGLMAAQPWKGWDILDQGRQDELGAVFRFQVINRVAAQPDMKPFSAVVECRERVPLRIVAGQFWQHRDAPDIEYPVDGSEPLGAADVPATLAARPTDRANAFPDRETFRFNLPRSTMIAAHIYSTADEGGELRVSVDGTVVADHTWPGGQPTPSPSNLSFRVGAGNHVVLIENPGKGWVGISAIDPGMDTSALALIGRRNDRFIEAWVWNRPNLYLTVPYPGVAGTIVLENVPAGSWKITWWDTKKGVAVDSRVVAHPGGTLRVDTPPIERHAAVVLVRAP